MPPRAPHLCTTARYRGPSADRVQHALRQAAALSGISGHHNGARGCPQDSHAAGDQYQPAAPILVTWLRCGHDLPQLWQSISARSGCRDDEEELKLADLSHAFRFMHESQHLKKQYVSRTLWYGTSAEPRDRVKNENACALHLFLGRETTETGAHGATSVQAIHPHRYQHMRWLHGS